MRYTELGSTGIKASRLGAGLMRLPVTDGNNAQIDRDAADLMLETLLDGGVNYFDTAYPYHGTDIFSGGNGELYCGDFMKTHGIRDRIYLATKLPTWLLNGPEDMARVFDEQLARLKTDRFDVYLVHALDPMMWEKMQKFGVLDFLEERIRAGQILHAGFSYHSSPENLPPILDAWEKWEIVQVQYNWLDGNFQGGSTCMDMSRERNFGTVVMEPLKGGYLGDRMPEPILEVFRKSFGQAYPAEISLRWLFDKPHVDVVLSGMSTLQQAMANIKTEACAPLGTQEAEKLEALRRKVQEMTLVGCTECRYCMPHCPVGVQIPMNLGLLNDLYTACGHTVERMTGELIKTYYSPFIRYGRLYPNEQASACISCGKCSAHCPQGIDIPAYLAEASRIFGTQ